jgi:hypothetical protein
MCEQIKPAIPQRPWNRVTARAARARVGAALSHTLLGSTLLALCPREASAEAVGAFDVPEAAPTHRLTLSADMGFLAVLAHELQDGEAGTRFDYRDEGAQDVLFPVSRFSVTLELGERHRIGLLYQPLELLTRERLGRPLTVDDTTYEAGTDMSFRYGFPFYRASYDYAVWVGRRGSLRLGGGLQLRNATIEFARADGTRLESSRSLGPVPLLRLGARQELGMPFWLELEVDGIYAPIKYLNGDDNGVEGALVDANVRLGIEAGEWWDVFLNARYLAGGAEGTDDDDAADSYSYNWLQFFILSVGVSVH